MLNLSLWANLLVAAFKLILGIAVQSFWLGAVGVFYGVLALMRFSLLRSFRRETPDAEQKAYRRTALLLNVLTLTMTGIFVQMIRDDQTYRYPGILIYVMAVWAFAMMILSVGKPNGEDAKRSRNDMSLLHLFFLGTALWIASVGFTEYMQNHFVRKNGK